MAYIKTLWVNKLVETPKTYNFQQNADATVTLIPAEGIVTEAGTPLTAAVMNNIEGGIEEVATSLADSSTQLATGTATAITLAITTLTNLFTKTFIVSADNGGVATTINTKPLYKPNTVIAPNLTSGKAVTVWYNLANDCFFIKASATGDALVGDVLAPKTFSNGDDTDLVGTIASKGSQTYTPSISTQTIASGQYLSGTQTISGDADLIPANIKKGKNLFNVVGTLTTTTTAGENITNRLLESTTGMVYTNNYSLICDFIMGYRGSVRISWKMRTENSSTPVQSDITLNGTEVVGSYHITQSTTVVTYIQDVSYVEGDIIAIRGRTDNTSYACIVSYVYVKINEEAIARGYVY